MLYLRAFGIWLLILPLAIANGGLREAVLRPWLGLPAAQLLSGVLLIGAIVVVALLLVPRLHATTRRELWCVGACWLVLTLLFEFGYGRLVQRHDWAEWLAAYTFHDGNLWPLVVLVTLLAPPLTGRVRPPSP